MNMGGQADFILVGEKVGELYGWDIFEWKGDAGLTVFFVRPCAADGPMPIVTKASLGEACNWIESMREPF